MVERSSEHIGIIVVCFFLAGNLLFGKNCDATEKETQACQQEMARIRAADQSLASGPTNDLAKYETFVDEIQQKWKRRDKECFARLMNAACGPLSSGQFNSRRQYELARKYALSALENRDSIPLSLEIQLTGHVATPAGGHGLPEKDDFAKRRKKDVEVRLHAWRRMMDAIDPNWNPDDVPVLNVLPPTATGLPGGIAPEAIKDAKLRAEYEAAIQRNRQKAERYSEQHELHFLLKTFPKNVEDYIVQAYSHTPYNVEELRKSFDKYKIDERTKILILDTVTKNSDNTNKKIPSSTRKDSIQGE